MRISAKARYGLAAMVYLADNGKADETVTILRISNELGVSKIYLEQVFAQLKHAGLVLSVKGPQGGYTLSKAAGKMSAFDILGAVETALFEETEETTAQKVPDYEGAIQQLVFRPLSAAIEQTLKAVSLSELVEEARSRNGNYMFFI